jgi:putative ABC transport system ATP-binding protein
MSLTVSHIKKSFYQGQDQIQVLQDVSFELPEGKLISIIGQSGSGKSTLLSLLAGLESADSGSINLTQQNLSKMNEKQRTQFRAKNISIVFQQYHLMPHLTALENVMLPLEILKKENAKSQALAMLTELGLDHRANHLPSQMSGGECQRVAIARALVVRPKLLLADEPSGNLDVKTGDKVMDVFFKVVKKFNITTVLVTHSPELAARCDSTWQLESGLLKEQST